MALSTMLQRVTRAQVFAMCAAYYLLNVTLMVIVYSRPAKHAAIFGSFWEAGKHLDYQAHPLVWRTGEGFLELNLNPPTLFPLFQLFALFDPQAGQIVWMIVSAALWLAVVWLLHKQATRAQIFWLLTLPTVYACLALGQIYILLFALGAAIWWCLKNDRALLASVLIGVLVALKPNFAVWGIVAFAAGHYRHALTAGAVALALFVLAAVLYGPSIYSEWLHAAALDQHGLHPHNVSLWAFFTRLGLNVSPYVVAAVAVAVIAWAVRFRPSLYDLTPVAVLVAILCSPLAWLDYVLVAAAFVIDRPWRLPMVAAAFLMFGSVWSGTVFHEHANLLIPISALCIAPPIIMLVYFMRRAVPVRQPIVLSGGSWASAT